MRARPASGRAASDEGRRVATVEVVPPVGSRPALASSLVLLAGSYLLLAVVSDVPAPGWLLAVAVFVVALVELLAERVPALGWALARVGLAVGARGLLRDLLLLAFAARACSGRLVVLTAAAGVVVLVAAVVRVGLLQGIEFLRSPPVLSRGLRLAVPGVPRLPAARLREPGAFAAWLELPAAVGLGVSAGSGDAAGELGLGLMVALSLVGPLVLARHAFLLWRGRVRSRVAEQVSEQLRDLQPEVVLYFGGSAGWRYQVEMWLEPVERLGRPAVVVVREPEVLSALAATSLPVVCVRNGSALTALDLSSAGLALYVANTGESIHLLRRRELRSAFIGHGDSDKSASSNPFARVYDEIWTAGEAGRQRFLEAGLGIDPARLVPIGRPQVPGAQDRTRPAGHPLTVLYAPTWEGWGDDPFASSLAVAGPALVRALLARAGVRVLYRPHPMSGSRDPALRRAGAEVIAALRGGGGVGAEVAPPLPTLRSAAPGDALDLALAAEVPWSRGEQAAAREDWDEQYWAAAPTAHRILAAPAPELFATFAVADVLVADVSSVTTEWLATGRPYAVVDGAGRGADAFRAAYPSASAGVVLPADLEPTGELLDALLAAARGESDPLAAERSRLRQHLLGPATPDPLGGLRAAVDRLCDRPRRAGPGTDH